MGPQPLTRTLSLTNVAVLTAWSATAAPSVVLHQGQESGSSNFVFHTVHIRPSAWAELLSFPLLHGPDACKLTQVL